MDVTLSQYRTYYKRLALKIALAMVIVAIVPLLTMAAFSRHFFVNSYKQKVLEHLTAIVRSHEQKIGNFVTDRLDAIRLMGATASSADLSDAKILQDRLKGLRDVYGKSVAGLAFCNEQGVHVAGAGLSELKQDGQRRSDIAGKVMERGYYVEHVQDGATEGRYLLLAAMVRESPEKGILVAAVNTEAVDLVLAEFQTDQVGRATILKRDDAILAAGNFGSSLSGVDCSQSRAPGGVNHQDMIVGELEDGSALCFKTKIKNTDWTLEVVLETQEAYKAFAQPRMLALSTLLLGIGGIIAVAILVSNRFSKYVARVDQEKQLINEHIVQAGKWAALGEMASGMAHEINNPVGIIVQEAQWIEALLQKGQESLSENLDEVKSSLEEIKTHGMRCRDIIVKLISFTRNDEPGVRSLQLNDLIRETIELCRQRAQSSNIDLRLNLDPELPPAIAAPSQVQQVLINLVNNSLDVMEEGGGSVEIRTTARARYAVVEVADTGPGIPQENIGRVFQPFFSTKPEGTGTGLGLAICYSMMKKMKGDITVTSQKGEGTTFHLFFLIDEHPQSGQIDPADSANDMGEAALFRRELGKKSG